MKSLRSEISENSHGELPMKSRIFRIASIDVPDGFLEEGASCQAPRDVVDGAVAIVFFVMCIVIWLVVWLP